MAEADSSWVDECLRWGQVNLRELEPTTADVGWWADYFKRTCIQGLTVNAGGIVAYYPTQIRHHQRSPNLGDRDLFGEFAEVARRQNLRLLARLDVGKTHLEAFHSHPEWFCRGSDGQIVRYLDSDLYYTCVNGPYYYEFTAEVMREVHQRYRVDGFFDNGWQSMPRTTDICRCTSCARKFTQDTGLALPKHPDWADRAWREWVQWRYKCLADAWAFFADTTRSLRPGSIYIGNLHRDFADLNASGVDWLRLAQLAAAVQVDLQGRSQRLQLWSPAELGRLMRECASGENGPKPHYDLFGQWYAGNPYMRVLSKPPAEQQAWLAGITVSGTRPWYHVIGADHAAGDRRWAIDGVIDKHFKWHHETERFHRGLRSAADVGLVYAPRSIDYYGKDDAHSRSVEPYSGWYYALMQARTPFNLVHERKLDEGSLAGYRLLILPNVACLDDDQIAQLRAFGQRGSVIATFETGLYDGWGEHRGEFGLSELLGVRWKGHPLEPSGHSYLRIRERHPALTGFEGTDILPSGAAICPAQALTADVVQPLGHIPPFIVLPPELTYIRTPDTDVSMLFLSQQGTSRRAYLPNDLDRVFWRTHLADLGRLLGNLVRWAMHDDPGLVINGAGILDVHTFHSSAGFQVRIANFTNPNLFKMPCTELYPVGPLEIRVRLPEAVRTDRARLLVAGEEAAVRTESGWTHLDVPTVRDFEIAVFEPA